MPKPRVSSAARLKAAIPMRLCEAFVTGEGTAPPLSGKKIVAAMSAAAALGSRRSPSVER